MAMHEVFPPASDLTRFPILIPVGNHQSLFGLDGTIRRFLGVRTRGRTNDPPKCRTERSDRFITAQEGNLGWSLFCEEKHVFCYCHSQVEQILDRGKSYHASKSFRKYRS